MKALIAIRLINKAIALSLLILTSYVNAGSFAPPTDIQFGLPVNIVEGHDLIEVAGPGNFGSEIAPSTNWEALHIDISSVFSENIVMYGSTYNAATQFKLNMHGNVIFDKNLNSSFLLVHPTVEDVGQDFFGNLGPTFAIQSSISCHFSIQPCPVLPPSTGGNSTGSNKVFYHLDPAHNVVTVTYDDRTYGSIWPRNADDTPTASQMRFHDIGNGNFVVEYRYENIGWAKETPAGWSNDDNLNFVTLDNNINYSSGSNINHPGVYAWMFVDGQYLPTHDLNRVLENSVNGTRIGTLSATDPDFNETFTYTLLDNAEGRFILMVENGVTWVVVADGGERLDVDDNESHDIRVRVTDRNSLTFDKTLAINVVKIPAFNATTHIQVPVGKSMTVTIPTNVEPGSGIPTITADGLPAWMSFSDNGDGTATLSGFPSFELTFRVTLTVTDGFGNVTSRTFNIKVTPEAVAPETSGTGTTTTTTVTVTDNDGKAASFGWLLLLIGSGLLARKRLQK